MKEKFTTIDLFAVLQELRQRLLGMRVANVYDIDQKTYLIRLARPDEKVVVLFESGCRIHTTEFEWPKNMQPSGFSMKCRKHLRGRRLVSITQLGVDRVVDLQFGSNEAAYHLIIELYDRGNVILTDHAYSILSLLRTRTDTDTEARFAVRETFRLETVKQEQPPPTPDVVQGFLVSAKPGEQLKHVLNPHFVYGSALLTHCLINAGFSDNVKVGAGFDREKDMSQLMAALEEADLIFHRLMDSPTKGYLIQKREVQPQVDESSENVEEGEIFTNVEFHPLLFRQHERSHFKECETFNKAVDEFFSSRTSQRQDVKALQMQKTAVKKLDNIRKDHLRRIDALQKSQEVDVYRAQLIEMNFDLVERATLVIRSAIASSMDWGDIELLVKDAQARGDPVAMVIQGLKLSSNEITLLLSEPDEVKESSSDEEGEGKGQDRVRQAPAKARKQYKKGTKVDIDLGLSAFSNARRYYDHRRHAAKKEQKTMGASEKALKSAEKKTKQTLKEVSTVAKIRKARKVHWFEKFFWFISSENYLVIGGRDQQQNELVVKKYLREGDLYVHADLHGASSIVLKNPSGGPVPPRTLTEAGCMAVTYSSAWEARIVTSAWWVYHRQVSKTAPTGEYLTTGSFMVRGKKNFLPPCQLQLGFGFLFRVDDSCVPNHLHERAVRVEDEMSLVSEAASELTLQESIEEEELGGDSGSEDEEQGPREGRSSEGQDGREEEEEEEEEEEMSYPDTAIHLQHVGGDRYELQRGTSVASSQADDTATGGDIDPGGKEEEGEEGEATARTGHQYLSAKKRKELKKQRFPVDGGKAPDAKDTQTRGQSGKKQPKELPQPLPQHKRGQKSKQKRVKEKYADQDEEERQLMMEILASAGPTKDKDRKTKVKGRKHKKNPTQPSNPKHKYYQREREKAGGTQHGLLADTGHKQRAPLFVSVAEDLGERPEPQERQPLELEGDSERLETVPQLVIEGMEGGGDLLQEVSRTDATTPQVQATEDLHVAAAAVLEGAPGESCTTRTESQTFGGTGPGEGVATVGEGGMQHSRISAEASAVQAVAEDDPHEESDEEEKRALLAEENIRLLEEAEKEQLSVLDSLSGCPLPDDILLYAIPVCAPYTAVLNYKYKVKLVPGTNRRGKAARAAVHRFIQSKEGTQREKDLLKSVKDNDLSRYIPGKVKMTLPQAHKR